jgi:hypothetical protein
MMKDNCGGGKVPNKRMNLEDGLPGKGPDIVEESSDTAHLEICSVVWIINVLRLEGKKINA